MSSNPNTPFRSSLPVPGGPRKSIESNLSTPSTSTSSSSSSEATAAAANNNTSKLTGPRKSLSALRTPNSSTNPDSLSNPTMTTPTRFVTPRRTSLSSGSSSSAFTTPNNPYSSNNVPPVPPLPTSTSSFTSSTISSAAKARSRSNVDSTNSGTRRGRELEIGDEVMIEGSGEIGVLRHLGPVQFKAGLLYAGLELIRDSVGKGKNDGSVAGVQYFATTPLNGMFCVASKVIALSSTPPTDATARPQSALSNRSSSRASDVFSDKESSSRPPSTTPGSSAKIRRSSITPSQNGRSTSSMSNTRPSSSMSNYRNASTPSHHTRPHSSLGNSRPSSRASVSGPRKSVVSEEEERRAKTSAEKAAALESTIKPTSRVHKLIGMKAKDMEAQKQSKSGVRTENEVANGRASPLKDSLLSRTPGGGLPRPRPSLGSALSSGSSTSGIGKMNVAGLPGPRAAKGRVSMFAKSEMPPPPSPTKGGRSENSPSAKFGNLGLGIGRERTESEISNEPTLDGRALAPPKRFLSYPSGEKNSGSPKKYTERNRQLLEEMDLTPKRPSFKNSPSINDQAGRDFMAMGMPSSANSNRDEFLIEPTVPITLFEEQSLELEKLKEEFEKLKSSTSKDQDLLQAQKTFSIKEKDYKLLLENSNKEVQVLKETSEKQLHGFENEKTSLVSQLKESTKLSEELKKLIDSAREDQESVEAVKVSHESSLNAKLAEIESLKSSVERLETEKETGKEEVKELNAKIEDLMKSGREAMGLFEKEVRERDSNLFEADERIHQLEQQLEQQATAASTDQSAAISTAATIDNANLREQLNHASSRIVSLEDQLADSTQAVEQDRENTRRRKERSAEVESDLKAEIKRLKTEIEAQTSSNTDLRSRVEELHDALTESQAALENERAEVETLRADVENLETLGGGPSGEGVEEAAKKFEAEKTKLDNEVERLTGLLEGARSGKREARRDAMAKEAELKAVKEQLERAEEAKKEMDRRLASATQEQESQHSEVIKSLRQALEEKTHELDTIKRSSLPLNEQILRLQTAHTHQMAAKDEDLRHLRNNLDSARQSARSLVGSPMLPSQDTNPSPNLSASNFDRSSNLDSPRASGDRDREHSEASKRTSVASTSSRRSRLSTGAIDPEATSKQIAGLNYMIKSLNEESSNIKHKHRLLKEELEAENQTLRDSSRSLELVVEALTQDLAAKIKDEKQDSEGVDAESVESLVQLRTQAAKDTARIETKAKDLEREIQTLKKIVKEKDASAEEIRQEVTDLESLIEARLYENEALESKVDSLRKERNDLRDRLERRESHRTSASNSSTISGTNVSPSNGRNRGSSVSTSSIGQNVDDRNETDKDEDECNLCGRNDHELVNCSLFKTNKKGEASPAVKVPKNEAEEDEPCDDCGETGHSLDDCPYAAEIF